MSKVVVHAGACGHTTEIEVTQIDREHVRVVLHSTCQQITSMGPDLEHLKWRGKEHVVFLPIDRSAVYRSGGQHRLHTACPVPSAIIKAIEVELGLAVPRDVTMVIQAPNTQRPEE